MPEVWTMGEILVEVMRRKAGIPLYEPGEFLGPYPSGAPAIFIDAVARLKHSAGIIGGVADDDFGRCVLERLGADGVEVRLVERAPNRATAVAFVSYSKDGSRKFIYHIDGTPAGEARFAEEAVEAGVRFFHVMGCSLMVNERLRAEIFEAAERFRAAGARISFDPNIRPELLADRELMQVVGPVLTRCSVLLPGTEELTLLSRSEDPGEAARILFRNPGLQIIALKRGKEGATVYTREEAVDIPPCPVREVDPTGAGDCFDAGFLCGLLEGKPLRECGTIAAAAGALNAAAFGPMEGNIGVQAVGELAGS